MSPIAVFFLWALAVPAVGSCAYLLGLTLLSARIKPPRPSTRTLRFDVIIPAHNEANGISDVVKSVLSVDWPTNQFRTIVVADNCTDATADCARRAGAEVLVRQNDQLRGKGHALQFAFQESRMRNWSSAVIVIDADSRVSPNLLEAIAVRFESGEQAVQVHYGVSNPNASWRTRLMAIALGAFHKVRSRGRERLKLSCGIRGNGWAVTHALLARVPFERFSLAEDVDYGIDVGMHGARIAYADEASCDGEMVSGEANSRSQRRRWEQGRMEILRNRLLPLLHRAVFHRSLVCLDLAMDLLVLPLSYVALNATALTIVGWWIADHSGQSAGFFAGALCCAALALYVFRGWQLSNTGLRGLIDLLRAPFFLVWKLVVLLQKRRTTEWVRTGREGS